MPFVVSIVSLRCRFSSRTEACIVGSG